MLTREPMNKIPYDDASDNMTDIKKYIYFHYLMLMIEGKLFHPITYLSSQNFSFNIVFSISHDHFHNFTIAAFYMIYCFYRAKVPGPQLKNVFYYIHNPGFRSE